MKDGDTEDIPAKDQLEQRHQGPWWLVSERGARQFGIPEHRCKVDVATEEALSGPLSTGGSVQADRKRLQ